MTTAITLMEAPAGRKASASKWGKLFTGFKFNDNKDVDTRVTEVKIQSPTKNKNGPTTSESEMVDSPFSVNQTQPLDGPSRKMSFAWTDSFRKGSDTPSDKSESSQKGSLAAPQVGGVRRGSWFQSSNPDEDVEVPSRKFSQMSVQSAQSNDSHGTPSRRGSYTPRNAAAQFLNTVTNIDERQNYDYEHDRRRPSTVARDTRRQSVTAMDRRGSAAVSEGSSGSATSSRRPSYTPRNAASGFMRSATAMSEERRESLRHVPDSLVTKASALQESPKQQQHLSRRASRDVLERHRMQSLTGIASIADIDEAPEEPSPSPDEAARVQRMQSVPAMSSSYASAPSVNVQPSTPDNIDVEDIKTTDLEYNPYFCLSNDVSPRSRSFEEAPRSPWTSSTSDEELSSRPETPLELLGFRGAMEV